MSVSEQAGAEDSDSAVTAATGAVDEQIQLFLAAIRSDDGEGIVAAFYHVIELGGAAGMAIVGTVLNDSALTDAMLAALTKRAENLRTPLAWLHLADAAFTVGRESLGFEAAGTALKIDPATPNAALIVSAAANRRGEYDEALRVISDLVARVPEAKDEPRFILQTAVAEINRGQPTAALALIDAAMPRLIAAGLEFDAQVLRARALRGITGRGDEVVSAWERALTMAVAQQSAQVEGVRQELIAALWETERYAECLREIDLVLAAITDPTDRTAWLKMRVNVLVKKGDIDGALAGMDDLLATAAPGERLDFRLQQAGIAAMAARWKEAAAYFDAALAEVPKDAAAPSEQRSRILMQKAHTLAMHEIDLVLTDLDELDDTWPATVWPTPIDIRVNALYAAGKAAQALEWLDARVARTPELENHPAVYQLRAEIAIKLGHTTEAMVECRRAVELVASAVDQRGLGAVLMCAFGSQQWNAAVDAYDRLGHLDSAAASEPSVRIVAALAYLRRNELETALKLTEGASLAPPVILAMRGVCRGEAYLKLGRYDEVLAATAEGLKYCEDARASVPPTQIPDEYLLSLHTLRAQAFNQREKSEEARKAATAAIDISDQPGATLPGLAALVRLGAYMQRAVALYRLDQTTAAHADINAAIEGLARLRNSPVMTLMEQAPEFQNFACALWYSKGALLNSESRNEDALAAFTRAEKVEKHGAAAAIARGYALFNTGAFAEATFAFDTALTRGSSLERADAFAGKGRALIRLRKFEKAITALQASLDARLTTIEEDPVVFEQLGIAYNALRRYGPAKRAFDRAWELTNKDKRHANLARGITAAELRLGEPERALAFIKSLPNELADDRTLLFNRALALDALGRRDEAIPFMVRAKDAGLDRAQLELDRLDAPDALRRWTHYWFNTQASQTRQVLGIVLMIIAAAVLGAPLYQWWLSGKPEWYLLLLPSVLALLVLALPNMKSIGFEGAGLSVSVEPLSATGREAAEVAVPETFVDRELESSIRLAALSSMSGFSVSKDTVQDVLMVGSVFAIPRESTFVELGAVQAPLLNLVAGPK